SSRIPICSSFLAHQPSCADLILPRQERPSLPRRKRSAWLTSNSLCHQANVYTAKPLVGVATHLSRDESVFLRRSRETSRKSATVRIDQLANQWRGSAAATRRNDDKQLLRPGTTSV